MKLVFFIISFGILILVIIWQIGIFKNLILSPFNPQNINIQLRHTQKQTDTYNRMIENVQNQTDDAMKSIK